MSEENEISLQESHNTLVDVIENMTLKRNEFDELRDALQDMTDYYGETCIWPRDVACDLLDKLHDKYGATKKSRSSES